MSKLVPLEPPLERGAIKRNIVFGILRKNGVTISEDEDETILAKDGVIEAHKLGPIIHRRLVNRFARIFKIPISTFYLGS
jgi:hypothetical protein